MLRTFLKRKKKNISVLHANTMNSIPIEDVNLNFIQTICKEFAVVIGFSDSTLGIEVIGILALTDYQTDELI
jgi:sialic acid synthase SpsE